VDAARKVVGVGSVRTRAWIILMRGRDGEDSLFLQLKEAQPSQLCAYATPPARATARSVGAINAPAIHRIGKKNPIQNSQ
jgi:uncharacterized protein (DUF2252 family)